MDKSYSYRAQLKIINGGYPREWTGVEPTDSSWHPTTNPTGSATYSYYYTDTNLGPQEVNSSQVYVSATDEWECSINNSTNVLTVKVHTIINSITRRNKRGNPAYGNYTRDIVLRRSSGGANVFTKLKDPIGYNHSISGKIDLGTETFTLSPGQSFSRSSFYILNHTSGFSWASKYYDEMEAGISFMNTLPFPGGGGGGEGDDSYRPGAVYNGSSWESTNREKEWAPTTGNAAIYCGGDWNEMRTIDGPTGSGNPPEIYNGDYHNMRRIGNNAEDPNKEEG